MQVGFEKIEINDQRGCLNAADRRTDRCGRTGRHRLNLQQDVGNGARSTSFP
jgi:hypothetical protein